MKALWLLAAAGFIFMANGYASDPQPIPRMSSVCPPGYARSGAYCVPVADNPKPAAQANGLGYARFRIGKYLLHETDSRRSCAGPPGWGMASGAILAETARCLLELPSREGYAPIVLAIVDGTIVSLAGSFDRRPSRGGRCPRSSPDSTRG